MKRKWIHPSEPESSRVHWRSLGELEGSEEFEGWLGREFPQGAAELELDETSRRSFVKLMGASTALAGFGVACKRPVEFLVPFNEGVEWLVPGKALYYSTAKPRLGGLGCDPLVVTTHDGRPTKVDGNRLHPAVNGGSNSFTQASVLDLYDQDRSKGILRDGKPSTREDFETSFLAPFREAKSGEKAALLVSPSTSPTRNALLAEVLAAYPGMKAFSYEALAPRGALRAAAQLHGEGALPVVDLSGARRILTLDCDFLGNDPVGEDSIGEFSPTRDPEAEGGMARLYSIEPAFTITGGQADHRYRLPASQMLPAAILLGTKLGELLGDEALSAAMAPFAASVLPVVYNTAWLDECAADFASKPGESIILAGSRQDASLHLVVAAINRALGAYGELIRVVHHELPALEGIGRLAAAIREGEIETLFILNEGDVAFDAPSNLRFGELLDTVAAVVQLGHRENETTARAGWHLPRAHYLESWGDHCTLSGHYSVQQPMILPLWGGISENALLLSLLQEEAGESDVLVKVQENFTALGKGEWEATLRDGHLGEPVRETVAFEGPVEIDAAATRIADLPYRESLEVSLTPGCGTYDGRFANNGWLQEAPDPITKLTWDNAALISFATAREFELDDEDLVEISVGGERRVVVPVLRSPGHADHCVSLAVGYYGAKGRGAVSEGAGFDAYPLMTSAQPYVVTGALLRKVGRKHDLALTSEHYSMEGRAIARIGTLAMYQEKPGFAEHQGMDSHIPENISLYKGPDYETGENPRAVIGALPGHEFRIDPLHQWAMTVDLNACTGCNACLVACQAENNIPIVGKTQVRMGREMHWIRMDRYFTSPKDHEHIFDRGGAWDYFTGAESTKDEAGRRTVDDDQVEMIHQPVACQQCESAPCETVCPVNATVHTSDGLNAMAYNRCIGTRYCANNCPYKARRFNYFDYNKRPLDQLYMGPLAPASGNATTTQKLQKNPNVTVRMRGVIEKCTYCVQRITSAKIAAKAAARDSDDIQVKANSFTVACQDACGAKAITFGNLKAEGDRVLEAKANPRNYELLKYIGTIPRTTFLARIKNPNPKMPGADQVGTVTSKMH